MSLRTREIVVCLGVAALAGALMSAAPKGEDANKALAEAQRKLARQALDELDLLHRNGQLSLVDPKVAVWERRQIEALRASGAGQGELVAALEAYAKRMNDLARLAEAAHEKGALAHVDVLDARYRALEAEMWLNREKSR